MKKEHIDSELYEILHFTPEVSSEIHNKIDSAYEKIKSTTGKTHKKRKFRSGFFMGIAAAVLLTIGFIGFSNPVLAGKIPFIGRIFQMIESRIGYPGDYSENAVKFSSSDAESKNENISEGEISVDNNNAKEESPAMKADSDTYSQTIGDVTITLSEACYSDMALYFSLELYSEEGFPESFNKVKNMPDYILSYDFLNMQSSQSFDFSQPETDSRTFTAAIEEGLPTPYSIEGNYVDSHTFLGIVRVDLDEIKEITGIDTLPPEFIYSFTILKFWGTTDKAKEVTVTDPDTGEIFTIQQAVKQYYEGPWKFTFPVSLNTTNTQIREIMETNADGIGISTVTKTPYELKADIILPEGAERFDYFVAVTDADGKILDSQGQRAEIYSVYGRKTNIVHIYVVDYDTYMDECKAENAYRLPEKALFQATVTW